MDHFDYAGFLFYSGAMLYYDPEDFTPEPTRSEFCEVCRRGDPEQCEIGTYYGEMCANAAAAFAAARKAKKDAKRRVEIARDPYDELENPRVTRAKRKRATRKYK